MTTRRLALAIQIVSWAFVALGLVLPLVFASGPFAVYREALAEWALASAAEPAGHDQVLALLLGITGGSIVGKWVVHALLARGPLAEGSAWAWRASLVGLAAWFLIDSAASLALGATFNIWMINLARVLFVALPLVAFRRLFEGPALVLALPSAAASRAALATSVIGVFLGLAIAFGGDTALFSAWWRGLAASLDGALPLDPSLHRVALFFFGPIGGCTAAQFAMLALWLRGEGATPRAGAAGAGSILAWFVVDSGYGLGHGGAFNIAMVNLPALAMTLTPWLALGSRVRPGRD